MLNYNAYKHVHIDSQDCYSSDGDRLEYNATRGKWVLNVCPSIYHNTQTSLEATTGRILSELSRLPA